MKKHSRFVLTATVLALFLLIAGQGLCKDTKLLFATGGVSGTFYPLGGAIAQVWNQKIAGLNVTVQATGGSLENVRLLGSKDAEVAICMNDIAYYGQHPPHGGPHVRLLLRDRGRHYSACVPGGHGRGCHRQIGPDENGSECD
jgi:TRAP transporter TAXI family solute receptor